MAPPLLVLGGIGILLRGALAALRGASVTATLTVLVGLIAKLIIAVMISPIVFFVIRLTLKLAFFVIVYKFFTGWVLFRIYDVAQAALTLLPGADHPGFTRFWQFVSATDAFIPWDHIGTTGKWVAIILLWVALWRYIEWVLTASMNFMKWIFS